ncbi:MAG: hypothetical protein KIS29_10400, partial [Thermoplasmata archaeon]|nr:hypothetical protein [Candidatus Sysuiplasma jiujiangense]
DYGQFQRSRKKEWVGVSVCPYCGEMDTYNSPKRTTKMCSKHKKPFDVYPGDAIHWQEITAEWVEAEAERIKAAETEKPKAKKRMHPNSLKNLGLSPTRMENSKESEGTETRISATDKELNAINEKGA